MKFELIKLKAVYKKCSNNPKKCKFDKAKAKEGSKRPFQPMQVDDFLILMENNYGTCPNPGNQYYKMKIGKLDPECSKDAELKRNFVFQKT